MGQDAGGGNGKVGRREAFRSVSGIQRAAVVKNLRQPPAPQNMQSR
jgi:hypothetical protein